MSVNNENESLITPYFVIHRDLLDNGYYKLKTALDTYWGNNIIGYSYKTNSLPWVVDYFNMKGCYAEVVSDDEYYLAKSIGVKKHRLIYNGIAKSKDTFLEAITNQAVVNIDSEYEIDWLSELQNRDYSVGIRVNFDLESRCPGQTQCGKEGERFGFCYENGELKNAIDRIEKLGVRVKGLHLHKSSKTRMPDIYKAIAEVAVEIGREYELKLDYIDIGGGFFGGLEAKPQFQEYFSMVSEILKQQYCPDETALIVEPGMALIGAPIDFVTTVVDVKKTNRNTFVVTNGSRTQIDPLMTKAKYFHEINRICGLGRKVVDCQIISGFTCMEHDRLFEINNEKELLPGDTIIYHKVGAYTICLTPLFIKWFPRVYVKDGNELIKVRDRWNVEDFKGGSNKL